MSAPADPRLADLPALLAERGVVVGYRLTVAAPKGAVDGDLKALLAKYKPLVVQAMTKADVIANPAVSWKDVLTTDDDGFDWVDVEQDVAFSAAAAALATDGDAERRPR